MVWRWRNYKIYITLGLHLDTTNNKGHSNTKLNRRYGHAIQMIAYTL